MYIGPLKINKVYRSITYVLCKLLIILDFSLGVPWSAWDSAGWRIYAT